MEQNTLAIIGVLSYIFGAFSSVVFQLMYWMLKMRKDVNEAHKAIRSIKGKKR